ncbi:O-antigen ligase family protein [Flavobacterium cyclinae]|uniref:O-antigen ligase family protein n=1 Tax=Flavobacterium cyclinae TaxID=2895947 RepID=UPI001E4B104F|nr:O-antigen ligase family protein [Flavobacterium cyclinae]UGS20541.1 O-antigen ligase family protein [Flavobacterium cyclinae]
MKSNQRTYLLILGLHVLLAFLIYAVPFLSKIYGVLIPLLGTILLVNSKNKNNEVLLITSYVVGVEVFLRMTGGNAVHELAKYEVIIFFILGMLYSGISKNAIIYLFFILLLLPGVYIGANVLGYEVDVRKAILFNILGEVALFVSALYCFNRKVTLTQIEYIIKAIALPLVSMVVYLFLYTPSIRDVVTGTQSNFATSGGFGPNQVSTILGLGMFCFFALLILFSKSKLVFLVHLALLLMTSFRGIVTFSRGGVLTAIAMIVVLIFVLYWFANTKAKSIIVILTISSLIIGGFVWTYSVLQTGGMIENRYANKDARGREKVDKLGGRGEIANTELIMFLENPVWGIGVGKNKEYREQMTGIEAASHNEITRLLAEHGVFGILAFMILLFTPLIFYLNNREHIFLISFFVFWLLTINHAAMRIAAPAFIYALTLLKVSFVDENTIHRKPTV